MFVRQPTNTLTSIGLHAETISDTLPHQIFVFDIFEWEVSLMLSGFSQMLSIFLVLVVYGEITWETDKSKYKKTQHTNFSKFTF